MTGKELKIKLASVGVTASSIAEKLGISPQAINSTFNASDVKSGTLERIAVALGVDMSFFYPMKQTTETTTNIERTKARNINTGDGSITDTGSVDDGILKKLLEQNNQLIEIIKNKS